MQYLRHNTLLAHHTDRSPTGLGQYDDLGEYCGPYTSSSVFLILIRVYGQFSIETKHERRKQNREFSGLFFSVLLIRIGKQNVEIIVK